ncbi:MAG: RES family NAD+ phosphorylase [Burkholderiales bacterium]|jgi:RES domain-containing protein|nr:RES family NAD+ phosphorylase [Burkholderiales bacterium]
MASVEAGHVSVWRIAKHTREFAADDINGGGAAAVGGRWNSEGKHVVYAATSVSLCVLETLAHLGDDIHCRNRFLVAIDIPARLWTERQTLSAQDLPKTWLAEPAGMDTVRLGDHWLTHANELLLLVPSVIVPEEFNLLINPGHKHARQIKARVVRPFIYDPRLA